MIVEVDRGCIGKYCCAMECKVMVYVKIKIVDKNCGDCGRCYDNGPE